VMEAFFSSVKSEVADRFDSCGDAKMELFDYIEVFYNQRRRHSTIGYLSPAEFERRTAHGREGRLDGALSGMHALTPQSLAQAAERLHDFLPPLKEEHNVEDMDRG
jgi:integrase-like protein